MKTDELMVEITAKIPLACYESMVKIQANMGAELTEIHAENKDAVEYLAGLFIVKGMAELTSTIEKQKQEKIRDGTKN